MLRWPGLCTHPQRPTSAAPVASDPPSHPCSVYPQGFHFLSSPSPGNGYIEGKELENFFQELESARKGTGVVRSPRGWGPPLGWDVHTAALVASSLNEEALIKSNRGAVGLLGEGEGVGTEVQVIHQLPLSCWDAGGCGTWAIWCHPSQATCPESPVLEHGDGDEDGVGMEVG